MRKRTSSSSLAPRRRLAGALPLPLPFARFCVAVSGSDEIASPLGSPVCASSPIGRVLPSRSLQRQDAQRSAETHVEHAGQMGERPISARRQCACQRFGHSSPGQCAP